MTGLLSRRALLAGPAATLIPQRKKRRCPVGWNTQAVIAALVVVQGDNGGVFVYNSSGQLVASMAALPDVDPQTQSNASGVAAYANGTWARLVAAQLQLSSTGAASNVATVGLLGSLVNTLSLISASNGADTQSQMLLVPSSDSPQGVAQVVIGGNTPTTNRLLEVQGTAEVGGILTPGAGTNSSGSAPSPAQSLTLGSAQQLSDLTRDYELYLSFSGAGNLTIQAGPTSAVARTILPATAVVAGALYRVRMPAGWFIKLTGTNTVAIASQEVVGC